MTKNQQLMQQAKAALAGGWGTAALATLIVTLIEGATSFTYVLALLVVGPLSYGMFAYLNKQADEHKQDLNLLFSAFTQRLGDTLVAGLLISLAVGLGCVLLIVPGIILGLGFSMTYLVMLDNPNISGIDAMKESWNLMKGYKWSLFCLYCRFIGWLLLCILTLGILSFWIQPYIQMSIIQFYRQLPVRAQIANF